MEYKAAGKERNALQRVVFIIRYEKHFTPEDFQLIDKNSKNWKNFLPRRSVTSAINVQPGLNRVSFNDEKIAGLTYESLSRDGTVEFGLRFDESRILFVCGRYTSWSEIWPNAESHLAQAVKLIPEDNKIVSYSSEYSDLFQATGDYLDFDAREILRENSKFIPPHIYGRKENFHFHTGFFEIFDKPAKHRVLTRINADLRDNDDGKIRELTIVLFHQISAFREPWAIETDLDKKIRDRNLENFVDIHQLDKEYLKDIINDNISQSIGL